MAKVYLSYSSHIAKVLRKELSRDGSPIDLPAGIRPASYWRKSEPYLTPIELKRKPSLRSMLIDALRVNSGNPKGMPYMLCYSEDEYNSFPESEEKKNELVAFAIPKTLTIGNKTVRTNSQTIMEKKRGQLFRQATIYYVYEILRNHLHSEELNAHKRNENFNLSESIRTFADKYDMTSCEQATLLTQCYRRLMRQP